MQKEKEKKNHSHFHLAWANLQSMEVDFPFQDRHVCN